MKKIIPNFLSLIAFCASLTTLFLSMRALMAIGGFCAEGGPYVIETHCPKGVAYLTPLSIFAMIGSGMFYISSSIPYKNRPQWWYFFWSALFFSLGWNFFEFGINPPGNQGRDISWLICGIVFALMAIGPFFLVDKNDWLSIMIGEKTLDPLTSQKVYKPDILVLALHIIGVIGGIFIGTQIIKI